MKKIITLLLLTVNIQILANSHHEIEQIIQSNHEPFGVVFELVEGDKDAWQWAGPLLKSHTDALRKKYPDIAIAIVSHGYEQFQLTKSSAQTNQKTLNILTELVGKQSADLHVCGTHSSWYQVPDEDYIDIVDVAVSGPAKINDYLNLDYQLVELVDPNL